MKKKMIVGWILVFSLFSVFPKPVLALSQYTHIEDRNGKITICEPRGDVIDYQYTYINGVRYRRLYNFTKNKPLSDWERA